MRLWIAVLVSFAAWGAVPAAEELEVSVTAGDGAVHNVRDPNPFAPVVQVRDSAGRPVLNAIVTFRLPELGPGGDFAGGKQLTMVTDAAGEARAQGLRLNPETGEWQIHVVAAWRGRKGYATIAQVSAAPLAEETQSHLTWAIWLPLGVALASAVGAIAIIGACLRMQPAATNS